MDSVKKAILIKELQPVLGQHEGDRNKRYKDSKGIWTIGIGHNIESMGLPDDIKMFEQTNGWITDEMINRLFATDISTAISDCETVYPKFDQFPDHIQIALVDIMFNFGRTRWVASFPSTTMILHATEHVDRHLVCLTVVRASEKALRQSP